MPRNFKHICYEDGERISGCYYYKHKECPKTCKFARKMIQKDLEKLAERGISEKTPKSSPPFPMENT
jgi:hypothetical protein